MSGIQFQKSVLKNGVRVLTEAHPSNRAVCAGIFVDCGSRDEPDGLHGAAHFIEHLVFKGTKTRSAFEIAKSLEAVGGDLNAYTTREFTCFHTLSLSEHLNISLDVLCDLATAATFNKKDFENERAVILREDEMSRDQLDEWIFDLMFEGCFRGHPLSRAILGTRESLTQMSLRRLKNYYARMYQGDHMIVCVTGPVDHRDVVDQVERRLSGVESVENKSAFVPRTRPEMRSFKKMMERSSELAHILLSWPASAFTDELRFESYIANAVLGGGMTSRMYQSIREERGLAYAVYSSLQSFTDSGLLTIYAGTGKSKVVQTLQLIRSEIEKLVNEGLSQAELDFYKTQIKGQILLGADDMENRMNSVGVNEMVFGRYRPVDLVIEEIDAVSLQSVRRYLDHFLKLDQLKAVLIGDVNSKSIEKQLAKL